MIIICPDTGLIVDMQWIFMDRPSGFIKHGWKIPELNEGLPGKITYFYGQFSSTPCLITGRYLCKFVTRLLMISYIFLGDHSGDFWGDKVLQKKVADVVPNVGWFGSIFTLTFGIEMKFQMWFDLHHHIQELWMILRPCFDIWSKLSRIKSRFKRSFHDEIPPGNLTWLWKITTHYVYGHVQ